MENIFTQHRQYSMRPIFFQERTMNTILCNNYGFWEVIQLRRVFQQQKKHDDLISHSAISVILNPRDSAI